MTRRILPGLFGFFMLLACLLSPAVADTAANSKTVGNVVIYMGLLPAEMIRGRHPGEHPEASMHGGVPSESREYHLTIALFEAKSGARITHAEISARVSEIGRAGEEKKLEPMEIAGTETYGNYFRMSGTGPFRISLAIHVPGNPQKIIAEFEHRHQ